MKYLKVPIMYAVEDPQWFFGVWPWSHGPLFELGENWEFLFLDPTGVRKFVIPKGYQFDKASIPPLLWGFPFNYLPDGKCTVPALEHDFLCDLYLGGSPALFDMMGYEPAPVHTTDIHKHFYNRLLDYGVRPSKARAMWEAVRKFGPGSWIRPSTWFKKKDE